MASFLAFLLAASLVAAAAATATVGPGIFCKEREQLRSTVAACADAKGMLNDRKVCCNELDKKGERCPWSAVTMLKSKLGAPVQGLYDGGEGYSSDACKRAVDDLPRVDDCCGRLVGLPDGCYRVALRYFKQKGADLKELCPSQ